MGFTAPFSYLTQDFRSRSIIFQGWTQKAQDQVDGCESSELRPVTKNHSSAGRLVAFYRVGHQVQVARQAYSVNTWG